MAERAADRSHSAHAAASQSCQHARQTSQSPLHRCCPGAEPTIAVFRKVAINRDVAEGHIARQVACCNHDRRSDATRCHSVVEHVGGLVSAWNADADSRAFSDPPFKLARLLELGQEALRAGARPRISLVVPQRSRGGLRLSAVHVPHDRSSHTNRQGQLGV